ncbi:ASCH domain-containing protein [Luteolibacter pohnpeiensis]|uniref:ASCH domain-containing protein n=1 Tax=Luteolibacter pohnpeiensis TaxID=454153 RepID=A0A934VYL9_9BACT|nr:ASCH domain-containing protein [Luteolibacter pohnpeiensis]MBK1884659.1 ASCH domain-containing protein [Luteolibacter pohnpeiensis]
MKALSIRQPWAWLIVNGHKDIENRQWRTHYRGKILVHAAKKMTREEHAVAAAMAAEQGVTIPAYDDLERGGIVGEVEIVDCVDVDPSPWFIGQWGFVLKDAKPQPLMPCNGKLGFFHVGKEAA